MNVLINKEEMIDAVGREYAKTARNLKVSMVDAFFEDRVSIDNVKAAFDISEEAERNLSEIYTLEAKIKAECDDPVEWISVLKEVVKSTKEKTDSLKSILENL